MESVAPVGSSSSGKATVFCKDAEDLDSKDRLDVTLIEEVGEDTVGARFDPLLCNYNKALIY
jgi:hypothetical protein